MNDDDPIDIAALTALLALVQGQLPWRADPNGFDPILDARGNSIVNVDQGMGDNDSAYVEMGDGDREYIVAACNALPELLALLAAAQAVCEAVLVWERTPEPSPAYPALIRAVNEWVKVSGYDHMAAIRREHGDESTSTAGGE